MSGRAGRVGHDTAWRAPLAAGLVLYACQAYADPVATDPRDLVIETTERVLRTLDQQRELLKTNPRHVYVIVDDIIVPHVDFPRMTRWVLGKYWRKASDAQQQRFSDEFRALIVRTYATALLEYKNQKVEYLPQRQGSEGGSVTIQTKIRQPGAPPVPVDYRLYRNGQNVWKVYDMSIDGISLVTTYRTSFATEIRRSGLDGLIMKLEERNRRAVSDE